MGWGAARHVEARCLAAAVGSFYGMKASFALNAATVWDLNVLNHLFLKI